MDEALSDRPPFDARAAARRELCKKRPDLDLASRDPALWSYADTEVIIEALSVFWTPGPDAERASLRLRELLAQAELGLASHAPFESDPEEPPHPELIRLDWEFFRSTSSIPSGTPGRCARSSWLAKRSTCRRPFTRSRSASRTPSSRMGAPHGVLPTDFLVWSDGDYSYIDYVFRGVAKAARLVDPPAGVRDFE